MIKMNGCLLVAIIFSTFSDSFNQGVPICNPNPCKESYCSLDKYLKPVCHCPLGFHGANCTSRLCNVRLFPSKVFLGKTYLDNDLFIKFENLGDLAKKCNVTVNVKQSFTRSLKPEHDVPVNETALYIGRGIAFDLKDLNGKPAQSADSGCFLKGVASLGLVHTNGVIQDKEYIVDSAEYQNLKTVKQVGCALNNDLPQVEPSKLVGHWELVERIKWKEYLEANEVGFFTGLILQVLKPDMILNNDGNLWYLSFRSTFKSVDYVLKIGQEKIETNPLNGFESKCILTKEGKDKIKGNCTLYSNPPKFLSDTREIIDGQLVQHMTVKDIVCKLVWKRKEF